MATKEYITSVELESYFVDKDTGAPLAGGYIEYFKDADRTQGKDVFQKVPNGFDTSGTPLYQFVTLGDVVQLSGVGTTQDANGNNVAVYYYPWDADGNVELYYISVFNSLGVAEFVREGWPNTFGTDNPNAGADNISENQISNPQFALVNFEPSLGLTVSFSGTGSKVVPIAPDWNLEIGFGGAGSVTITRQSIAGSASLVTNPPYMLTVTPGSNVTSLNLVQKLTSNPGIWTANADGTGGFVAANCILGVGTSTTKIFYTPSVGTAVKILEASNTTGAEVREFTTNTQLPVSDNTANSNVGYVNITIELSKTVATQISSIQIVSLSKDVGIVKYEQETVNRQVDHLFNYYKDLLASKPIPSYLIGWDFPLNPAQFLTSTVSAIASGDATSNYYWDQTIIFQEKNSGVAVARATDGSLEITTATDTKIAIVQYLDQATARDMLANYLSSNIRCFTDNATDLTATVSLWYTTDAQLPNIKSTDFKSIVKTLDAYGYPDTQNGTWTQIARSNLSNNSTAANTYTNAAQFTLPNTQSVHADYGFSQWKDTGAGNTTATYFAIVLGTGTITSGKKLTIQSISCVPGNIPTIPAPQKINEVLSDCERLYWDTFPPGVKPADGLNSIINSINYKALIANTAGATSVFVQYPVTMRAIPTAIYYNPINGGGASGKWCQSTGTDSATAVTQTIGQSSVGVLNPQDAGVSAANVLCVHGSFDSRFGVVL